MTSTTQTQPFAASLSIDRTRPTRLSIVAWVVTSVFALMMTISGVLYIVSPPAIVDTFHHLGYPLHFAKLLGIAKLLGAAALVAPRTRTLREWAYAGFTFDFVAAIASHLMSGDKPAVAAPAVFTLVLVIASYLLRRAVWRTSAST